MRRLFLILLLSIIYFSGKSQAQVINKFGVPLIKNYESTEYSGSGQNWAITQDSRGVMFFGNNDDGVLEFDGKSWISHTVNNKSDVRSLDVDSNDIVYVGATGEFGYLSPDLSGRLNYHILSNQLDSTQAFKDQVLKTYSVENNVYFCTPTNIYIYKNLKFEKVIKLPTYSYLSFVIDNKIYVGNYGQGLLKYNGDSLIEIKNTDAFKLKSITSIIKNKNKFIISTFNNGIFLYDVKTGNVSNFIKDDKINNLTKSSAIYHMIKLSDGNFAIATLFDDQGLLIFSPDGKLLYKINTKFGILDNQITYLFQKNSGPIWLSLNKDGISRIDYNKPIWKFYKQSGIKGGVNNVNYFNNTIYIGTDLGEFYLAPNDENLNFFEKIPTLTNQVWTSCKVNNGKNKQLLVVGTSQGVFTIDENNTVKSIEKNLIGIKNKSETFQCYKLFASERNPGIVFVGYPKGVAIFQYKDQKWYELKRINSLGVLIKEIVETQNGDLWLSSDHDGIFKIQNYLGDDKVSHYDIRRGLPSLKQLNFSIFNNKLYVATQNGIYTYDAKKDNFSPDSTLGSRYFNKKITISAFKFIKNEYYFSLKDEKRKKYWVESEVFKNNKITQVKENIYKQIPNNLFDIGYFISPDKNKYFYVNDNVFNINPNIDYNFNETFYTLIRKVSLNEDSIIFNGTNYLQKIIGDDTLLVPSINQTKENVKINYKNNDLTFQYSANYFNQDAPLQYSVYLEGNDSKWSKWSTQTRTTKNNLYEGDYVFNVKAKNIYGVESQIAKFSFSIEPPWFRTIWAYISYVILFILVVYIIVKLNSARLIKEKEQLEEIVLQRTAEIRKQKEHIEEIHQEITDSIHYAKRIQTAILPPEDHVTESVPEHFILFKPKDIVSGDYHWATIIRDNNGDVSKLVVTAADCTGHGVPGAFMSMLGVSFLNEIVVERKILQSNLILNNMRENVIQSLQQTGAEGEQKDGMDMALAVIDLKDKIVQFSGANNPMYIVRHRDKEPVTLNNGNEVKFLDEGGDYILYEIKPDKMPIAIYLKMDDFTLNQINYKKGDTIYMFSDGFADQFGGPKGKKFKYKPFKRILLNVQEKSLSEQKEEINKAIEDWKAFINPLNNNPYEQIDDIVVIGIRL